MLGAGNLPQSNLQDQAVLYQVSVWWKYIFIKTRLFPPVMKYFYELIMCVLSIKNNKGEFLKEHACSRIPFLHFSI